MINFANLISLGCPLNQKQEQIIQCLMILHHKKVTNPMSRYWFRTNYQKKGEEKKRLLHHVNFLKIYKK